MDKKIKLFLGRQFPQKCDAVSFVRRYTKFHNAGAIYIPTNPVKVFSFPAVFLATFVVLDLHFLGD